MMNKQKLIVEHTVIKTPETLKDKNVTIQTEKPEFDIEGILVSLMKKKIERGKFSYKNRH